MKTKERENILGERKTKKKQKGSEKLVEYRFKHRKTDNNQEKSDHLVLMILYREKKKRRGKKQKRYCYKSKNRIGEDR